MPALPPRPRQPGPPPVVSSFTVATSTSPRTREDDEADLASFEGQALARALSAAGPASLAVKLSWVERLSAPGNSLELMKQAQRVLDPPTYADLLEERHMESLCPYPACANPAATPYRSEEERAADSRRFKVRMMGNGLFEAPSRGGAEDKGAYCSLRCKARSEWYRAILGRDGEGDLLEEVEERRKDVARSTRELLEEQEAAAQARKEEKAQDTPAGGGTAASSSSFSSSPAGKSAAFANDLLSSLTIHEKATSSAAPSAPTPESARQDFERPAPPPPASSSSSAAGPESSSVTGARFPFTPAPRAGSSSSPPSAGSALLPFNTASLTRTVLRATSSQPLPPPPRQPSQRGPNGLPSIQFLSGPRMMNERGQEIEWVGVDEEGESDEVRGMMEEALRIRSMVERGEL
ncbi:hypothetical protein JCM8097_002512 [Rhodosporidiobolus ruineniae]